MTTKPAPGYLQPLLHLSAVERVGRRAVARAFRRPFPRRRRRRLRMSWLPMAHYVALLPRRPPRQMARACRQAALLQCRSRGWLVVMHAATMATSTAVATAVATVEEVWGPAHHRLSAVACLVQPESTHYTTIAVSLERRKMQWRCRKTGANGMGVGVGGGDGKGGGGEWGCWGEGEAEAELFLC